jgi:hypothetical protein
MIAAVVRFDGVTEAHRGIGITVALGKMKTVPQFLYRSHDVLRARAGPNSQVI